MPSRSSEAGYASGLVLHVENRGAEIVGVVAHVTAGKYSGRVRHARAAPPDLDNVKLDRAVLRVLQDEGG